TTVSPRSRSRSAVWYPMKPAAPVTRIFVIAERTSPDGVTFRATEEDITRRREDSGIEILGSSCVRAFFGIKSAQAAQQGAGSARRSRFRWTSPSSLMPAVSIAALRELIEQRFPDATPANWRAAEPVVTGVGPLDRILPGGGLPRGQLTVWSPQGGACSMLRAACRATVANGERSVWIDTAGTIVGAFWETGPYLVQPKSRKHALIGAEELLR